MNEWFASLKAAWLKDPGSLAWSSNWLFLYLYAGPEVNFFDHQPLWQVDLKIHLPQ